MKQNRIEQAKALLGEAGMEAPPAETDENYDKVVNIRLSIGDYEALKKHFKQAHGLPLASGLRSIIVAYVNNNRLRRQ